MSHRAAAWLAWALAGITFAVFVATIPLWFLARGADLPSSWRADVGVGGLVGGAFFLAFPLVGALIASKRPKNAVGWLCLAVGALWALSGVFDRFPDLQMYFAETRIGWIPFWMETMDYWYHRHVHWAERLLDFTPLELPNPSDYVRRNLYLSVQHVERFVSQPRAADDADRISSMLIGNSIETFGDVTNRFIPGRWDQLAAFLVTNHRRANTRLVIDERMTKAAFDAKKLAVDTVDIAIARDRAQHFAAA